MSEDLPTASEFAKPLIAKQAEKNIVIDFGNDGYQVDATLTKDGDKWCVLFGEDLIDGVAGFGGQIWEAIAEFKSNFRNA
jgi:hypothetical protein